jgi:hypothetical protein
MSPSSLCWTIRHRSSSQVRVAEGTTQLLCEDGRAKREEGSYQLCRSDAAASIDWKELVKYKRADGVDLRLRFTFLLTTSQGLGCPH